MMLARALQAINTQAINMNHAGHYLHWGFIQISLANLLVIVVMVILFVLALILPFPKDRRRK